MNDCITNCQGRQPCTCGQLHTANSDGSNPVGDPWDWVSSLCTVALMTLCGVVCVAVILTAIVFIC